MNVLSYYDAKKKLYLKMKEEQSDVTCLGFFLLNPKRFLFGLFSFRTERQKRAQQRRKEKPFARFFRNTERDTHRDASRARVFLYNCVLFCVLNRFGREEGSLGKSYIHFKRDFESFASGNCLYHIHTEREREFDDDENDE